MVDQPPKCALCDGQTRPLVNQPATGPTKYTINCDKCSAEAAEVFRAHFNEKRALKLTDSDSSDESTVTTTNASPYTACWLERERNAIVCKRQRIATLEKQLERARIAVVDMKDKYLTNCALNL